jgi:hypothetical protein
MAPGREGYWRTARCLRFAAMLARGECARVRSVWRSSRLNVCVHPSLLSPWGGAAHSRGHARGCASRIGRGCVSAALACKPAEDSVFEAASSALLHVLRHECVPSEASQSKQEADAESNSLTVAALAASPPLTLGAQCWPPSPASQSGASQRRPITTYPRSRKTKMSYSSRSWRAPQTGEEAAKCVHERRRTSGRGWHT